MTEFTIKQIAVATDHENGEIVLALDANGDIWEKHYTKKKIKIGDRPGHKEGETIDVIRFDTYIFWRKINITPEVTLLHKGMQYTGQFTPCEETEIT